MGTELYPYGYEWLQPALRNFVDNPITVLFVHRWGAIMAYATLVTIPVLLLFLIFQGAFVKSIATTGLK